MKKQEETLQEKVTIELKNRIVVLSLTPLDTDTNMDEFTTIHYHNIMGEILTCSTALNRAGNMLADYDSILSEAKLDFEIFEAQMHEEKRRALTFETTDAKGSIKINKPTVDDINAAIIRSPEYKVKQLNLIKIQKNRDMINSWYWAIKSKDEKLNKISEKLRPEDFESDLLEEKINGVLMKSFKKTI